MEASMRKRMYKLAGHRMKLIHTFVPDYCRQSTVEVYLG